jgi:hypothetical protein
MSRIDVLRQTVPAPSNPMRNTMFSLLWIVCGGAMGCSDSSSSDAHVGSRDCNVIAEASPDPATGESCKKCQKKPCGEVGCDLFPCVNNEIVVQGCNEDEDCTGLTPFCGKYMAPNNVCVTDDDI